MKTIYYIRHGESETNARGIWGGHIDSALTNLGRQQAKKAALQAQDNELSFDLMIVSPLKRARETADIIEGSVPVSRRQTNDLLIERDFGDIQHTSVDEFYKDHTYKDIDSVPNAETIEQLQQRAQKFLDGIKQLPEEKILVVGHSAFGRALRRCINNQPWTAEYDIEVVALPNAKIIKLS